MAGRFSVDTVFGAKDNMSGPMGRMAAKATAFERALGKANSLADRGAAAARTFATTTVVAGAGVGAFALSIGKTGADFEEAISAVGAVGLQTRDQIRDLEKEALRLGAATKFTATDAANAMETMARAGFKNHEILAGVGGVLSAAAASGLEMSEVANVVSNALKGMGLEANQAARVADVLSLASSRTNSTIGTLGESLKVFAPIARQLNIPLESAVAQVALLQDAGLDASMAGTALAATYSKLAAPMGETKKALKDLGLTITDVAGNMKRPDQLLSEILASTGKIKGNVGKMAAVTRLVGLESQKALLNISSAAAEGKLAQLTAELERAEGSAEKMAALRMDNLKGDWEKLMSAVEGVQVSLFQLEGGPLRGIVQGVNAWVDANAKLIESEFHTYLEKSIKLVDNFTDGLSAGFEKAEPAINLVGKALELVFGDESSGPSFKAYKLGKTIGTLAAAFGTYWLVTKAVTAATVVWGVVTGTVSGIFVTLKGIYQGAAWALGIYRAVTWASMAATWQMAGAALSVNALLVAQRVSAFGAAVGMKALAVASWAASAPVLAVAAALAAVVAAGYMLFRFMEENGGFEGLKGAVGIGTDDWGFAGVDEVMNRQAKARRKSEDAKKSDAEAERNRPKKIVDLSDGADPGKFEDWIKANGAPGMTNLPDMLKGLEGLSGKMPPGLVMSPEEAAITARMNAADAGGATPTASGPPVVSLKDESTAQLSQNLSRDVATALRGNIKIEIKDKGGNADVSSSAGPGVEVNQSGGF